GSAGAAAVVLRGRSEPITSHRIEAGKQIKNALIACTLQTNMICGSNWSIKRRGVAYRSKAQASAAPGKTASAPGTTTDGNHFQTGYPSIRQVYQGTTSTLVNRYAVNVA